MARELIIELGDDFAPIADPVRVRQRADRSRRGLLALAVAVVAVLALTGSTVPAGPAVRRLATITASAGGSLMKVGSDLIVADVRDGHNAMTTYALPSGRQLWSTTLTVLANDVDLQRVGDVVLAGFHNVDTSGDLTDAINVRSGAMLWHSSGELIQTYPQTGEALLATQFANDVERFTMLDATSGQIRWIERHPAGCNTNLAAHLVVLCAAAATLSVISLGAGDVIAHRDVDLGADYSTGTGPYDEIKLAEQDGVVIVGHPGSPGPWMDAYRVDDLKQIWRKPFFDSAYIEACRQIFCMSDSRVSTGLDPQTGATLPFPGFDPPADDFRMIGPGPANPDDRLALIPAGSTPMSERDSGPERSAGQADGPQPGYANASSVPAYADSEVVAVPSPTRVNSWLVSVRVQPGPPGELVVTPVQQLAGVGVQSCVLIGAYLACATDRTRMTLYDVSKLTRDAAGGR